MAASIETINKNYEVFKELEGALKASDNGRFALMRNGKVYSVYDSSRDALSIGADLFEDGQFSVQQIGIPPINLGYYSYA